MTATQIYEAAWVPGLEHEIDQDKSVLVGLDWLTQAERKYGGAGVIVMYAKQMASSLPAEASRWETVSRRSTRPHGRGPVLAIWPPDDRTLEFAETLALRTALCVIPGTLLDVSPWIRRTDARCLVEGFAVEEAPSLPAEVTKSLDSMLFYGGHNNFVGGGEKENAIPPLREISRRSDAPSREQIENYLRASGKTGAKGIARIGKWYVEINDGRRHLDYARREIR